MLTLSAYRIRRLLTYICHVLAGFEYQIDHVLNGNEAKLVDFVKMANKRIKSIARTLPEDAPSGISNESPARFEEGVKEIKDVLSTERSALHFVAKQASSKYKPSAALGENPETTDPPLCEIECCLSRL